MAHANSTATWDHHIDGAEPLPPAEVAAVQEDEHGATYEISYPAASPQGGAA